MEDSPAAKGNEGNRAEADRLEKELSDEALAMGELDSKERGPIPRERLIAWVQKYEQEYVPRVIASGSHVSVVQETPIGWIYVATLRTLLRSEIPSFNFSRRADDLLDGKT